MRGRIIWVFLDGVGLGLADVAVNPLMDPGLENFARFAGGQAWTLEARPIRRPDHVFVPLDATLGVPGLPQSGTGQASLFTGINCAAIAGRHWGPFPHSTSIPVIKAHSIFARLAGAGRSAQFVNAFPDRFFRTVGPRNRWTVTTRCCVEAGIPLKTETDLRAGNAITAELTGQAWHERLGLDVPIISPADAGRRLVALADAADFTLFEYYLTDKAGHSRDRARAGKVLMELDEFVGAIMEAVDESDCLLVVTSDHGNLEDLSSRVHTLNPVPLAARGKGAASLAAARDITDLTPALVELLERHDPRPSAF
jgi:2,3-bisphosphoglycerate-independent phosphoglycerate mutase